MIFVAYRITKPYLHSQLNEIARRNSKYHFSVLFFVRQEFYDAIQLTVEKLAERIQGIGRDGFVRLHPADGRTADTGLACKVYVVAPCRFMVCHKGSYEIILVVSSTSFFTYLYYCL